jgi:tetratricopeptide (TPR) repeat protein
MNDLKNKPSVFSTTLTILIVLLLLFNLIAVLSGVRVSFQEGAPKWVWEDAGNPASATLPASVNALKQLALQLKSDRFLDEACIAFEEYLERFGEKGLETAPGIYASLANDYFDISEFKKALVYFYKAEAGMNQLADHHPAKKELEETFQKDWASKQMVCLEKLGRTQDADLLLEKKLSSGNAEKDDSSVLAIMGTQKLTVQDFNREIQKLAPAAQERLNKDPQAKKTFFYQWLLTHLLYKKALRIALDKEPEMLLKLKAAEHQLLANTLLVKELGPVEPTLVDLKNYYNSHPQQFTKTGEKDPRPFEEIKKEVIESFTLQKQNEKAQTLLNKLLMEERVRLFDENLL